jgi:ferric-dicitrate binding protein FerR (iron transport regulator)
MVYCRMQRIHYLLTQYLSNQATEAETREMLQWLRENKHNEALLEEAWKEHGGQAPAADRQRMWANIEASTAPASVRLLSRRTLYRLSAAAAVVVLAVAAVYLLRQPHLPTALPAAVTQNIAPGKNGAILTLSDGSRISLDSTITGIVASQNGAKAIINNNGLEYKPTSDSSAEVTYNTVTTPKGRQFNLTLPDGSRVWLNAGSSIRFPTRFDGAERRVEIGGEAYFEIARNKDRPFIVRAGPSEIKVLGTEFNVNAYPEEGVVKTTLLSGSIAASLLTKPGHGALLKPGEQAQLWPGTGTKILMGIDTAQAVAWKNGAFNFQNLTLQEVMRQLARWYDLEVIYEKGIPDVQFAGEMSRTVPLSDLLPGLKDMGIHCRLESGRRLIVSP